MKLWDKGTGQMLKSFEEHTRYVRSVAISPDGQSILSGSHTNSVRCLAFSPNGQSILSGSFDDTIKLWDKGTGKMLKSFEEHTRSVRSVACFHLMGNKIKSHNDAHNHDPNS